MNPNTQSIDAATAYLAKCGSLEKLAEPTPTIGRDPVVDLPLMAKLMGKGGGK